MAHQVEVTVCARIKPGATGALKQVLDEIGRDSAHNAVLPFGDLVALHFGRLLIVEALSSGPCLLLMLDSDAPLKWLLPDVADKAGKGLDLVFGLCLGYPPPGQRTRATRLRYLRSNIADVDMFYVHTVGRTLQQIRQEAQLRQAIELFIDQSGHPVAARSPLELRAAIQAFVNREPALAWARRPAASPELSFRVREALHLIGVPALLLVVAPVVAPAALAWLVALRIHELTDPAPNMVLDPTTQRELGELEDFVVQNPISTIAAIKPDWFWYLTAAIFYDVGNYTSRHIFNNGDLAGLRTVHFARFMHIDNRSRVLFTSYYDGSLEAYNNDFIDQVGWVLNSMFGNQVGYPTTRWLFGAGATDERGFKTFIRGHQVPTQVWYSAYPELSAANVGNNALLRAGLYGKMNLAQAEEWLRHL